MADSEFQSLEAPVEKRATHAHKIVNHLFLGNLEAANDTSWLEEHHIQRVLSILSTQTFPSYDSSKFDKVNIHHKSIEADDASSQMIAKYFPEAVEFIRESISKEENILVHCRQGVSRSATIVCAYLMSLHTDWSPVETVSFVRNSRSIADPNSGFLFQLLVWKTNGFSYNDAYEKLFNDMKKSFLCQFEKIISDIDSLLLPQDEPSQKILDKFEKLCLDLWAHPYPSAKLIELQGDVIKRFPKWSRFGLRVNDYIGMHQISGYENRILFEEFDETSDEE